MCPDFTIKFFYEFKSNGSYYYSLHLMLTALPTCSVLQFIVERFTYLNEIRGPLLFKQEKVKQSACFRKIKSPHFWKVGWVCKDSVPTCLQKPELLAEN